MCRSTRKTCDCIPIQNNGCVWWVAKLIRCEYKKQSIQKKLRHVTLGQIGRFGSTNRTILLKIGITKSLPVAAVDSDFNRTGGH